MELAARIGTMAASGGLPSGFVRCEAVESYAEAESFIDVGIPANSLTNPTFEFGIVMMQGDYDYFGTNGTTERTVIFNVSPTINYIRWGSTSARPINYEPGYSYSDIYTPSRMTRFSIGGGASISDNVPIRVDGNLVGHFAAGEYGLDITVNIRILGGRGNVQGCIGEFRISDAGTVVCDLVPCYRRVSAQRVVVDRELTNTQSAKEYFDEALEGSGYSGVLYRTSGTESLGSGTVVILDSGVSVGGRRHMMSTPEWPAPNYDFYVSEGDIFESLEVGFYDIVRNVFLRTNGGIVAPIVNHVDGQ